MGIAEFLCILLVLASLYTHSWILLIVAGVLAIAVEIKSYLDDQY